MRAEARVIGLLSLAAYGSALVGCASSTRVASFGGFDGPPPEVLVGEYRNDHEEFGPPPPGYIKIVGEPMPDWRWGNIGPDMNPMQWQPLGPQPIVDEFWSGIDDASGRVVSIAPHPTNPDIVYIASASGGIWKTVDQGATWQPLTDELSVLNHGFVALDPSNPDRVYIGTGEWTTGSSGDGIFRSEDGGQTWERIATTAEVGTRCSGLAVAPGLPNVIHHTGNAGYQRSTDGGLSWTTTLAGNASSLQIHPTNPGILYVALAGDGIYRSTDLGTSFTKLTDGLPESGFGRIVLAISRSDPNRLYAAFTSGGDVLGTYRTDNGGDTWSELVNAPNFARPQAWYDCFVSVDPTDPNTVYAGGVFPTYGEAGVTRSTDGGQTWTDITFGALGTSQVHPDQHFLTFGPTGIIWLGNDGGVWKSVDNGGTWINTNATLTVTQNYNIALHPIDPNRVIGGTQDNGTVERMIDDPDWPQILAGDGGFAAYDFNDPDVRQYVTYVYLSVYRLENGGATYISGPWGGDPKNFIAPLVMDPNDARTLLGGTNRIWRTHNADTDATWTAISTDEIADGGTINAIAVARDFSNVIYAGNNRGGIWRTVDDGATWTNLSDGLPGGSVSDIFISPDDFNVAYASFYNSTGSRVFYTEDGGDNWVSVTGDLPEGVSARALEVDWTQDPHTLYVGSGHGVYVSLDGGITWIKDADDLPNVNIGDLAIDFTTRTITAGTYGRGGWRSPLAGDFCAADLDGDGDADADDFFAYLDAFANGTFEVCDQDGDGDCDADDFFQYLDLFAQGC